MNPTEAQLTRLFKKKEPPEGFAERVLARVARPPKARPPRLSRWLLAVACLGLFTVTGGLLQRQHERRTRAEGEKARAELIQALQISSEKLNLAFRKINHTKEES